MMILYVNGCSLTRGSCEGFNSSKELQNSISWSNVFNDKFDTIINDAISCSSNNLIISNTLKFVKNNYEIKNDIFIWICWSDPNRFEIFTNDREEVEILKNYPWGGKEFIYDGCKLNITSFWSNRFNNNIKDLYSIEANKLIEKIPKINNVINYHLINQDLTYNYEIFINQIILLQSFFQIHKIKYGMSFAIGFENQHKILSEKLIDFSTIFEPNNSMFNLLLKNNFNNDPTKHFYPEGYEFYGKQIAKFIEENYKL